MKKTMGHEMESAVTFFIEMSPQLQLRYIFSDPPLAPCTSPYRSPPILTLVRRSHDSMINIAASLRPVETVGGGGFEFQKSGVSFRLTIYTRLKKYQYDVGVRPIL